MTGPTTERSQKGQTTAASSPASNRVTTNDRGDRKPLQQANRNPKKPCNTDRRQITVRTKKSSNLQRKSALTEAAGGRNDGGRRATP